MKLNELTVLDSRIKEGINAEYTLDVTALRQDLALGEILEADEEPFRVVELSTVGCGKNIMNIHAEHISYDLNVDMPMLPDIVDTDPDTGQQTVTPNPHCMNDSYSPAAALDFILAGTGFTRGETLTAGVKEFRLGKMTRKQVLLKIAEFFNAELLFSNHTVSLVAQRGQDRGVQLRYAKNLKAIERIETKDGIGYKVDIVELRTLLGDAEAFELGDTVEILDETIGLAVKQRILSVDYDPLRRIHSNIEVGQRAETFAEIYEKDIVEIDERVDKKIEEALEGLELGDVTNEKIENVVKTTVLDAETIHAMNAWIDELEVNYLRTNFDDRMGSAGGNWDYIYAHDKTIEFVTAQLHATEKEQYKTASGKPLYYTAAKGENARKYFTLQKPRIKLGDMIEEGGVLRPLMIEDFIVYVPKIVKQFVKMTISFEGNGIPTLTLGTGSGAGDGKKAKIFKDENGLVIRYHKDENTAVTLSLTSAGVRVENVEGTTGQLRNIHIGTAEPQAGDLADGDLWVVI
ncbi:MAG: hypothetical protein Q4A78_09975 [Peptostreptococcaceae bacterium]|nr:hypothetical protein [Peptostreptococcaceae bacterium]